MEEYHRKCKKGFGRAYAAFSPVGVIGALTIALSSGFGFAVLLSIHMGFGLSVSDWWIPTLQAHGHSQVLGWLGLLIMGVSLFFVPRLSGVPHRHPRLVGYAAAFLFAGIALRSVGQPAAALTGSVWWTASLPISAAIEAVGIAFYLFLIASSVLRASPDRVALRSIKPYLLISVVGWITFLTLNLWLSYEAYAAGSAIYDIGWHRMTIDAYVGATLIPVALAFSVRTFPLYLRLPAADWGVQRFGIAYVLAFVVSWAADASILSGSSSDVVRVVSGFGHAFKGLMLALFVWNLDVLFRRREPWTASQIAEPTYGARATRRGLPDHGEFGNFNRLLYLAYGWLLVACILEVILGGERMLNLPQTIDADTIRHVYLAGFLSSLMIGMAPRMIPGFVHQRQVAYPSLVGVTFWLWALASGFRIVPLLLSSLLPESGGALTQAFAYAFGVSGLLGWSTLFILAWNLMATLWRARIALPAEEM